MVRWLVSFLALTILAWLLWQAGGAGPGQVLPDYQDQTTLLVTIGVVVALGIFAVFLAPVAPWLLVFLGLGLVALVVRQLALNPGELTIDWQGYVITTSVAFAIAVLAVAAVLIALLYRFWLAVMHGPSELGRSVRDRRRKQGLQALSRSLVAIAAGDAETAQRQIERTGDLLDDAPLTMLLSAQVAQLKGDEQAAERYFSQLAEKPSTAFLGLRGLLTQAMKRGDHDEALTLARRAHRINPKSEWLVSTLYELQKRAGQWTEAESTLDEAVRLRLIPAEDAKAQRSAIRHAQSLQTGGSEATKWAEKAYKADPANVDAAIRWADLLIAAGRHSKAAGVIETAWERQPSPELAEVYWRARKVQDDRGQFDAARRLAQRKPRDAESQLLVAAAAIGARQWAAARTSLEPLAAGEQPSARVCRLMAELEEGERGDLVKAREWLMRATAGEYGAHAGVPPPEPIDITPKAARAGGAQDRQNRAGTGGGDKGSEQAGGNAPAGEPEKSGTPGSADKARGADKATAA